MKKTSIIVHQNYLEDVIENLHKQGYMQIIDISKNTEEVFEGAQQASQHPEASVLTNYDLRITRLIDILKKYKPKKSGIKALLNPELPDVKKIEDNTLEDIYSHAEGMLEGIEKEILNYEKKLEQYTEKQDELKQEFLQIKYLRFFDMDLSDIGESDFLLVKTGKTDDLNSLKYKVDENDKIHLLSQKFGAGKQVEWAVVLIGYISEKEQLEKIARGNLTEFNIKSYSGQPQKVINGFKKENKEIKEKKNEIKKELQNFSVKNLSDLLAIREEIQLERARKEISKNFAKTDTTYIIQGWVLEEKTKNLQESIDNASEGHNICEFETPSENPDNPPTYIKTPKWAKGFKDLLEMFAIPRYNEMDPTILMGIFFVLFFGFMLGDAGYGSVIFGLSIVGFYKFGKFSSMIKNWSFMGIWLGLTTTIVGVLTNSLFGDFIPRFIYKNPDQALYSAQIMGVDLPVKPLNDPITILSIALILGLIQLNVGVILGIYQAYKQKKYKSMMTEKFCWVPLQLGGGMLIGFFILDFALSEILIYVSAILVIIGLLLLFLSAGPVGFFDITGYVGDWLSYARLLALGLATAGMALAFNVVAEIIPNMIPFVGIVFLPIILFIAHLANLGLQALGAGVHSLRLQYVEFFNRFYEGGGHKFTPFKLKRKYTKIEE